MQPHPGIDSPFLTLDVQDAAGGEELARLTRAARERAWDPAEIDFAAPFDAAAGIMPAAWYPELRTGAAAALAEREQHRLGDAVLHWLLSGILHGEQAALTICEQMGARFAHPAARAFAATQAAEEARHVAAFARYIALRWGAPAPAGDALGAYLGGLVATDSMAAKVVGINLLVEGFAMGAFANIAGHTRDRGLATMLREVMRDEAAHHQFGLLWAEHAAALAAPERRAARSAATQGFRALYLNLASIRQRRAVYGRFGLDWRRVHDEVRAARNGAPGPRGIEDNINPLTVLARVLAKSGLFPGDGHAFEAWLAR